MSIACKVRPIGEEALLPDGYRRCEYLESTGTQWIDTDFTPKIGDEINSVIYRDKTSTANNTLFSAGTGDNQLVIVLVYTPANSNNEETFYLRYFNDVATRVSIPLHTKIKVKVNNEGHIFINGVLKGVSTPIGEVNNTLKLFKRDDYTQFFIGRIYSFSISRNSQLQLNFIPCLDDKGKPCMFDTVSRTSYYNKGTGEFLYKLKTPLIRKLPRGYQPLEYLEATDSQWIDTGVKLSEDNDFKITCEFFSASEPDGNPHYAFGDLSSSIACYAILPTRYLPHFYLNTTNISFDNAAQRCVVEYTNNYVILNDIKQIFSNAGEAVTTAESIAVFSCRLGRFPFIGRIYSFGISRNGVLQLDFQPCLDPTGKPCMWDYVTRRPFYNQNTTGPDFLYG